MKKQAGIKNNRVHSFLSYKSEAVLLVLLFITIFCFDQGVAILKPLIGTPKSNVQVWNLQELFFQHVAIVVLATTASFVLAFGLGSWVHIGRFEQLKSNLLSFCGFGETFPTAALIALLVPLLGYGMESVVIALFIYGLMPIFSNTIEGLESVPKQISEAADGMGFTSIQKYTRVELKMGMPFILAGMRISLIINIAAATIGAVVGAGGLGMPIMSGIRIYDPILIMKGALPLILLALSVDGFFRKLEKRYGEWSTPVATTNRRKILSCIVLLFCIGSSSVRVSAESANVFDYDKGATYSSAQYYTIAQELVKIYPEILHLDIIGSSRDSKPIYAIMMTADVAQTMAKDDFYVVREHYYVEAGTHARETVNTAILLKIIEDYAKDYYDDRHIPEFNLKVELGKAAIHFIPLVNPDGFDLVKFGIGSVTSQTARDLLSVVATSDYSNFKANIAGIDLNRNYPDEYYDPVTMKWIDKFQVYRGNIVPDDPTNGYYAGPYAGSEPETAAVMAYAQKYDFRNFLSFHSRGKYIDCGKYWFGGDYNKRSITLATALNKVNNYKLEAYSSGEASGYFSDYAVAQTLKPVVTVETTLSPLPTEQKFYQEAYKENYLLPLYAVRQGREAGYFAYRLYIDGIYVRDFSEYIYAKAHADKVEGAVIVDGSGVPEMTLADSLASGDALMDSSKRLLDIQDHWGKEAIEILIDKGAINGYEDATFRPNNTITRAEFLKLAFTSATTAAAGKATTITKESINKHWAAGIFEAAMAEGILKKDEMPIISWNKPITRYEMVMILTRLAEKKLGEPKVDTSGIESIMSDYNQVVQNKAYIYYVEQAYTKRMVTGMDESGTFAGTHTGTRAEAAKMVLSLIDASKR